MDQLGLLQLSEHDHQLAEYVVVILTKRLFATYNLESMVDDIVFSRGDTTTDDEMYRVVSLIQKFDPAGVEQQLFRNVCYFSWKEKHKLLK